MKASFEVGFQCRGEHKHVGALAVTGQSSAVGLPEMATPGWKWPAKIS